MDVLTLGIGAILFVLMALVVVFAVRLWDLVTEASEFFARENERYRRTYERQQRES